MLKGLGKEQNQTKKHLPLYRELMMEKMMEKMMGKMMSFPELSIVPHITWFWLKVCLCNNVYHVSCIHVLPTIPSSVNSKSLTYCPNISTINLSCTLSFGQGW